MTLDSTPFYRTTAKVLAPLVILAAAIRALIAYNGPLWRDELLFIAIVRAESFRDILQVLRFHESHPPLFYALMRAWAALVGDTDARFLLFPIALGVILVPLMYLAGCRLYSQDQLVMKSCWRSCSPLGEDIID